MGIDAYIYLLAINLFAVAGLLLELISFVKEADRGRLLPLFLLVISHSMALLISLTVTDDPAQAGSILATLGIFSTFAVVWTLTGPISKLPAMWQRGMWVAMGLAIVLVMLPLVPIWPVPPSIHGLMIAIFGASLIYLTLVEKQWLLVAVPLLLALAHFLVLLGIETTSWFVNLIAYAELDWGHSLAKHR